MNITLGNRVFRVALSAGDGCYGSTTCSGGSPARGPAGHNVDDAKKAKQCRDPLPLAGVDRGVTYEHAVQNSIFRFGACKTIAAKIEMISDEACGVARYQPRHPGGAVFRWKGAGMKKEKVSIFRHAWYHFHNLLVRGTFARIVAFSIVSVMLCLILGFILSLVPSDDGDLLSSIWTTTLCALDGGTIAGIEANFGQKVALFFTTIFGIVFISVLVGIITTGIEEHLEHVAHEGSKVLEHRPHVLVLGCTQVTAEVLRSLAQYYEDGRHVEPVVVLEEKRDIVEVGKELDFVLKSFHKTNTIYRQGCPYNQDDLALCSIERAHTILVTAISDDEAIKTVLVCSALLKELGRKVPMFVVCEDEDAFTLLQGEDDEQIHLISPDSVLRHTVETMQDKLSATQVYIAGDKIEVPNQTRRLLIAANDRVEREESDDFVIHSLLELRSLCDRRQAEGNPLEIACMLYFDKNVEPAKRAGADETVIVGHLLADKISELIERV